MSKLYIFSGLPCSGKSTLGKELAKRTNATFIRIDTVEQGLRDICHYEVDGGEGYRLCYRIASENLKLGNNVIADSVNPWELTRKEWNQVAIDARSEFINIEVICSDENEHKKRVESRDSGIPTLKRITWEDIVTRDYHKWNMDRIQIDTFGKSIEECLNELEGRI